jgi:C4-dicarboxylate-binding protein DctP
MRITARYAAVLASVLAAGACGGGGRATKAGGPSGPVTLQIATSDDPGSRTNVWVQSFASRVDALSDGRLRIKPRPDAASASGKYERLLAQSVTSGKFELGMIPSHAWDLFGVTSLRALNAPFLITDQALLADVISGGLATTMLSGLDRVGLVGLALFPGPLAHPFGFDQPLLAAEDYQGKVLFAIESRTTEALLRELGAKSVRGSGFDRNLQAGVAMPYESGVEAIGTGNVTLFPMLESLVIGARAYERLDDHQRAILKQAAAETRTVAIDSFASDAASAREFCANAPGSARGIVRASPAQLRGLEAAAAPVYAALERDPLTRSAIAGIRARARALDAEPAPTCPAEPIPPLVGTASSELDGVYRFERTDAELGAVSHDRQLIDEFHGVFTVRLSGGKYCYEQKVPDARTYPNPHYTPGACGDYRLSGDRMTISARTGAPATLRWSRSASGDLRLKVISSGAWGAWADWGIAAEPWKRIG